MGDTSNVVVLGLLTLVFGLYVASGRRSTGKKTLLKLPIIGDLYRSPIEKPLLRWDAWSKEKGAIATPKLFGIVPLVVINTAEAATELLSQCSAWYSNRPGSVSIEMITGAARGQSKFTRHDARHRRAKHLKLHHRILSPSLGAVAAPRYQPIMELECKQLVKELLELARDSSGRVVASTDIYTLLERTQASIILTLHYGIRVATSDDPLFHEIVHVQERVTHTAANPGLPDFIPALRYLPAALSPWRHAADRFYAEQTRLYMRLLEAGDKAPGWNATKQARNVAAKYAGADKVPDVDLAFMLATSIQGGMETSPRALLWLFVAAITANPGFISRAHSVLDAVVGRERMPTFADRAAMPYIDGIVSELMRWRPISPGSIPRRADKADDYKGTRIAKGATVFANAWFIGRDAAVFDPALASLDAFAPERWLDGCDMQGPEDPAAAARQGELRTSLPLPVFGQGRRSCMGRRVALDSSFMQVASMLWAFDFERVHDVDPMDMVVTGFMTEPAPCQVMLKPRGTWVTDVVRGEYRSAVNSSGNIMGGAADAVGEV
ncbi:Uu.00g005310.m01.CDS01 [Anthostomella pinea]|uniref:Uu.00g005310.m01.CDS01 n=1 Tax=Anthostomella pinea TaxID=933095 RepID=A0AAI8VL27_9PEZI|nr:Uu.00g005310.m01.CDS01 [Anthostomella pinea]